MDQGVRAKIVKYDSGVRAKIVKYDAWLGSGGITDL